MLTIQIKTICRYFLGYVPAAQYKVPEGLRSYCVTRKLQIHANDGYGGNFVSSHGWSLRYNKQVGFKEDSFDLQRLRELCSLYAI